MKRIAIVLLIGLASAGLLSAQPYGYGPMMGQGFGPGPALPQAAPETKTIEGKLVFIDQHPALQAKDKTYMVRLPRFYYYAYTDNIKEGAQLKLEGFELPTIPGQDKPYFAVTKATINGKAYDFATMMAGRQLFNAYGQGRGGMMGGRGGMMGGRGGMMGGRW